MSPRALDREHRATFGRGNTGRKAEGTGTPPTNVVVDVALAVLIFFPAELLSRLARRRRP